MTTVSNEPSPSEAGNERPAPPPRALLAILDEWDPIGCGDDGPPAGEYDCLAEVVVDELRRGADLEQLRRRINDTLADHFGLVGAVPAPVLMALVDHWRRDQFGRVAPEWADRLTITPYAEVFDSMHPHWQAYLDGIKKTPGHLLRDVLAETGGRYEVVGDLPDRVLDDVRWGIAAGSTDPALAEVARSGEIRVSLEHLRDHDPDTTRIVYGCRLGPAD